MTEKIEIILAKPPKSGLAFCASMNIVMSIYPDFGKNEYEGTKVHKEEGDTIYGLILKVEDFYLLYCLLSR